MANPMDKNNIPLYNDEKLNKEIQKRKRQEENERRRQAEEQRKAEKLALKLSRFHVSEIPNTMLLAIYFMIITMGVSFYTGCYQYILYSIIGIVTTIYVGKRLKFNFDETLNILIWNITQTFKDFIDYRLKLDFFTDNDKRINKLTKVFVVVLILLNSKSIVYGLIFAIVIMIYLVSFANREFEVISNSANLISLGAFIGLIIKSILYSLIGGSFSIDFMNIIMINIFAIISFYTANLPIYEPTE